MGTLTRVVGGALRGSGLSNPSKSLLKALLDMPMSTSGVAVNEKTALASTAVMAAIRVVSEDLASLPLSVMQDSGKEKKEARDHYLYSLLHDMPNERMTSFTFRECLQAHVMSWGNAYAELELDAGGRVLSAWPLRPDWTHPLRVQGSRTIVYSTQDTPDGSQVYLPSERVMHIPGLGFDGLVGYSPIKLHKDAIGIAMAAEQFAGRFYSNGAWPGAVLTMKNELSDEAYKRLKREFRTMHQGLDNAQRMSILEEGMDIKTVGMPLDDAQFIETRKYQTNDIARIYRIPPHMIGDLEKATFSNIEHQQLQYVIHTLRPWLIRWEQGMSKDLLTQTDRKTYYFFFNVMGLLRGDALSRQQSLEVQRRNGVINADEWREVEDMNALPAGKGQAYLVPMNMGEIGNVIKPPEPPAPAPAPAPADTKQAGLRQVRSALARKRLAGSYKRMLQDTMGRILHRERMDVTKTAERFLVRGLRDEMATWLGDYYRGQRDWVARTLAPVTSSLAEAIRTEVTEELGLDALDLTPAFVKTAEEYTTRYADGHTSVSSAQLITIVRSSSDPLGDLARTFDLWESERLSRIVTAEIIRASNTFAIASFRDAGVTWLRWKSYGVGSCEDCAAMDGKIARIDGAFEVAPQEVCAMPPLHEGCECQVEAHSFVRGRDDFSLAEAMLGQQAELTRAIRSLDEKVAALATRPAPTLPARKALSFIKERDANGIERIVGAEMFPVKED